MLCTLAQVKDAVGIVGAADDARITALIAEVTQAIMRRYGREFVPHTTAMRTFGLRHHLVDLMPHELRHATSVVLHPESASPRSLIPNVDYVLLPIGAAEQTKTFLQMRVSARVSLSSEMATNFGVAQLQITGSWGAWADATAVAEDVRRAAIETVLSWLDRPAAAMAGIQELGETHRQLAPTAQGWDIPLSAHRKLVIYSRNLGAW